MIRGDGQVRVGRAVPAVFEPLESRVLLSAEPAGLPTGYSGPDGVTAVPLEVGLTETGETDGVTARNGEGLNRNTQFVTLDATILSEADLPTSVLLGVSPRISLPVRVTNNGNAAIPAGTQWWVGAYLYPEGTQLSPGKSGWPAIRLVTETGSFASALQPGQSIDVDLRFAISRGVIAGTYMLRVLTDTNGPLTQRFDADRIAVATQTIEVGERYVAFEAAVSAKVKLPSEVTAGDGTKVRLPITVTNSGNLPVNAKQRVFFWVYADEAKGAQTRLMGQYTGVLGGLAPGQTKAISVNLSMPRDLAAGDYTLRAVIDPLAYASKRGSTSNTASTAQAIRVAEGFVKLDAAVSDRAKLPEAMIAGDGTTLRLPVGITNHGNIAVERGQKIEVAVYAEALDGRLELAARMQGVSLSGLKPGKTKRINLSVKMPRGLASGDYTLRVEVDPHGQVTQSSTAGNTVWTTQTVRVTEADMKLDTEVSAKAKLPASVLSGDGTKIRLPISIANNGNVAVEKRQRIDVAVYADRAGGGSTLVTTMEDVSMSGLKPGKAKKLNLKVQLPIGLTDGDYTLRVVADASEEVTQSTTAGNTARTADAIRVTEGVMAFEVAILDQTRLPTTVASDGAAKIKLPINITNSGNLSIAKGQKVQVMIEADSPDHAPYSVLITRFENVSLSGLKPGQTKKLNLSFEMSTGFRNGDYTLSVTAFTPSGLGLSSTAYADNPFTVSDYSGSSSGGSHSGTSDAICFCTSNHVLIDINAFLG
ncbi:MAG: CARDB domain-containing protein [Planctomycetota bacterium]